MSRCLVHLAPALAVGLVAGAAQAVAPSIPNRTVLLQGLDKVTARVSRIEARVGQEVRFGTLVITPEACLTTPPTEPPESAAFLAIRDAGPVGEGREVFSGWMFGSSPAVSALEHPVYDVWVLECREPAIEPAPPPPAAAPSSRSRPVAPPPAR